MAVARWEDTRHHLGCVPWLRAFGRNFLKALPLLLLSLLLIMFLVIAIALALAMAMVQDMATALATLLVLAMAMAMLLATSAPGIKACKGGGVAQCHHRLIKASRRLALHGASPLTARQFQSSAAAVPRQCEENCDLLVVSCTNLQGLPSYVFEFRPAGKASLHVF